MNGMNRIGIAKGSTLGFSPKQRFPLHPNRMANGSLRAMLRPPKLLLRRWALKAWTWKRRWAPMVSRHWKNPTNWHLNMSIPKATFCQRFSNLELKNNEICTAFGNVQNLCWKKKSHRKRQKEPFCQGINFLAECCTGWCRCLWWLVGLVWFGLGWLLQPHHCRENLSQPPPVTSML